MDSESDSGWCHRAAVEVCKKVASGSVVRLGPSALGNLAGCYVNLAKSLSAANKRADNLEREITSIAATLGIEDAVIDGDPEDRFAEVITGVQNRDLDIEKLRAALRKVAVHPKRKTADDGYGEVTWLSDDIACDVCDREGYREEVHDDDCLARPPETTEEP